MICSSIDKLNTCDFGSFVRWTWNYICIRRYTLYCEKNYYYYLHKRVWLFPRKFVAKTAILAASDTIYDRRKNAQRGNVAPARRFAIVRYDNKYSAGSWGRSTGLETEITPGWQSQCRWYRGFMQKLLITEPCDESVRQHVTLGRGRSPPVPHLLTLYVRVRLIADLRSVCESRGATVVTSRCCSAIVRGR